MMLRRFIICSVLVASVILTTISAWSATYYVATTGNDTTGNGSSGTPWKTLQKCNDAAANGDTCIIKSGTYTTTATTNLLLITKSLTFRSETPLGAVISGNANHTNIGINVTANTVTIQDFDIKQFANVGVSINTAGFSGISVIGNHIHDIGNICSDSGQGFVGVYVSQVSQITVQRNIIDNVGRFGPGESGCSPGTPNWTHNDHGVYSSNTTHLTITYNIFYNNNNGYSVHLYPNGVTDLKVQHNTFADPNIAGIAGHIRIAETLTTADISNNISYNPTTTFIVNTATGHTNATVRNNLSTVGLIDSTTGLTLSGNLASTNPQLTNPASRDYSLTASSTPAIDGGVVISGLSYNGSAPDIGAFETWTHAACSVADATPTVINVTYNNNVFPPILPASGLTGFTARENAGAKTISSVSRAGDNQVNITFSSAFSAGTTIDYSYSGGNATDSALIGGTKTQPLLAITNQGCTNNIASGPSYSLNQTAFQWFGLRGTESTLPKKPSSAAAENTNIGIIVGGSGWIRFNVTCTGASCPSSGMFLRYSKNGGPYFVVPDAFGADNLAFCGSTPLDSVPSGTTSEQLASGGLTFDAGLLVRSSNAIPTVTLSQNHKTELAYCLQLDTDTPVGTTYDFRLYQQDGTTISNYTVTPRMTVIDVAAGGGF